MRFTYKVLIAITSLVGICLISHVIYYYNYLTDLRFNVVTERSNVSIAVQYRRNLMPVLVNSVVSFVDHEDSVFNRAVDARERELAGNRTLSASVRDRLGGALKKWAKERTPWQNMLSGIIAIAEQYPELKTSEAFQIFMTKMTETESNILERRTKYNDALNAYTTAVTMFPGNIYSNIFRFPSYEYYDDTTRSEWENVAISRQYRSIEQDGEQH
jgi:LemA protein